MAEIPTIQRPLVVGERLLIRANGKDTAHLETIDELGPHWFHCASGIAAKIKGSVFATVDDDGQPAALIEPPVAEPPPASANPARPLPEPDAPLPGRCGRPGRPGRVGGKALPAGRLEFYLAVRDAVDSGDFETMVDAHAAVLATWTKGGQTHLNNTRKYFTVRGWRSGIMTNAEATRRRWERQRAADAAAKAATEPAQPPCSPPAEPVQPPCKPAAGGGRGPKPAPERLAFYLAVKSEVDRQAGDTFAEIVAVVAQGRSSAAVPREPVKACRSYFDRQGWSTQVLSRQELATRRWERQQAAKAAPAAMPPAESAQSAEPAAEAAAAGADEDPRRCRVCGCTDDDCHACIERTGEPCHWVEADLCSACQDDLLALSEGDLPMLIEGVAELLATLRQCHSSLRLAARLVAVFDAHKETEVA